MLQRLFARNEPLRRLRDEGFELGLSPSCNHLLVEHVPYVNARREVQYGTIIAELALSGEILNPPGDHVVSFIGEQPCDVTGVEIGAIRHPNPPHLVDTGITADRKFSGRPEVPFRDFYEKVTRYVDILESPAQLIDPRATARTGRPYRLTEEESVFRYADTASSRAGISASIARFGGMTVGVVGVGGSGAYVLDFIAKLPIKEIHIFDGDRFSSHNAFRSPGAASLDQLHANTTKVKYFHSIYSAMRRGIVAHDDFVNGSNLDEVLKLGFVFLCLDQGSTKKEIVDALMAHSIPFVDVGMGLEKVDDALTGTLRVTSSHGDGEVTRSSIPFGDGGMNDEYAKNIQIVELNALNAALAVIRWKKMVGFYLDHEHEYECHYSIRRNHLLNIGADEASQNHQA